MPWYAANVKYRTEKAIKIFLESRGIEHYIPLHDDRPDIPCMVFIKTSYEQTLSLPAESGCPISFLSEGAGKKPLIIPDQQMQNFMILNNYADRIFTLPNPENLRGGERVKVVGGIFAGIEGELYRIKGHKRVVVRLGNLMSVAMDYIPKENLEKL